jgi:sec-independent protein translocase protein TatA
VPNLGFGELVIVFLIVMLIFGAGRLPQIGEGLGKAIRNLKRGLNTDDDIDVTPDVTHANKQVPTQAASHVEDAEVVDKVETK